MMQPQASYTGTATRHQAPQVGEGVAFQAPPTVFRYEWIRVFCRESLPPPG